MAGHAYRSDGRCRDESTGGPSDAPTDRAAGMAMMRAHAAYAAGRLRTPWADNTANGGETLRSIAHAVVLEAGGDLSEILCRLDGRFPDFSRRGWWNARSCQAGPADPDHRGRSCGCQPCRW